MQEQGTQENQKAFCEIASLAASLACLRIRRFLYSPAPISNPPRYGNLKFICDNFKLKTAIRFAVASCALIVATIAATKTGLSQEVKYVLPDPQHAVSINADSVARWHSGKFEVMHLKGEVKIAQGSLTASGEEAIVWIEVPSESVDLDDPKTDFRVVLYLEGNATIARGGKNPSRISDKVLLERLLTRNTVDLHAANKESADHETPIYRRASLKLESRLDTSHVGWPATDSSYLSKAQFESPNPVVVSPLTGAITQAPSSVLSSEPVFEVNPNAGSFPFGDNAQSFGDNAPSNNILPPDSNTPFSAPFQTPQNGQPGQGIRDPRPIDSFAQASSGPGGNDRISFGRRDSTSPINTTSGPNPNNPDERITVVEGGVRAQVESKELNLLAPFQGDRTSRLTILADNIVQWSTTGPNGSVVQELYLDGNVVFAKDGRTIEAQQMYYNVNARQGTILDAMIKTKLPGYAGKVRIKADVLQQIDENNLQAIGAALTTSQIGFPRYWVQSEAIALTHQRKFLYDAAGNQVFNPATGQPSIGDDYFVRAEGNRLYTNGIPTLFLPDYQTNLSDPGSLLRRFRIGNDDIFGFQIGVGVDLFRLLGRQRPPGTDWIGLLDVLSERGVGFGTEFSYQRNELFGFPGRVRGSYKSYFINDDGLDFLGRGRANLVPEEDFRGRTIANHRHDFLDGSVLRAELGFISDRNFLEQFYENQWDTGKDATTGVWFERNIGTQSFNVIADYQVNDFFTQTSWLPRLDHFIIGQPLGNRAIWSGHSSAGYGRLRAANAPENAIDAATFDLLAAETDATGFRFSTRQEIDFPIQLGPGKVVPYLLGDVTYWQEDLNNEDVTRGVGQVGIRASLPIWKIDPNVQSTLYNVNGLAHKVTFDVDAFVADSTEDLSRFALYDPIDDDAQEHFRRRFLFNTFGLEAGDDVPLQFDERFFALRSGLQGNVTSPSAEIADDLAVIKFGVRQRWQTRRGAPGRQRVVDWITLDAQTSFFPNADRDNFGTGAGMFDYDFRWHLGDRVTILSDGFADFFDQGLRTVSVGAYAERPEIGSIFVGVRSIEGPISSNIITASTVYRLSDHWGIKAGTSIDFGETGTIGNRLGIVYIGESFLWEVGFNFDASRDNFGVRFAIEPRFVGGGRIFRPGGVPIPPASSRYLE